ncbi:MAG: glycosyltransferase [Candidatus Helarchaeota archaeon]
MNSLLNKNDLSKNAWERSSDIFKRIIELKKLRIGAEIGVARGQNAENILSIKCIEKLYGVDPYVNIKGYHDPMNLKQPEFEKMYNEVIKKLSKFGGKYTHVRKFSHQAIKDVPDNLDFVYIDADHSYRGVWNDLCNWSKKVRVGGIIAGHAYAHSNFPGVKKAVDEFFRRFEWEIHKEGEGVWWVEKKFLNISFFIPAYNSENTIKEAVESIFDNNFETGDELIIVNDKSEDNTQKVINELKQKYPFIKCFNHIRNKGGAAARNTAVENAKNPILFCLDSDNILAPNSIKRLKQFLMYKGLDSACFKELHFFKEKKDNITHKWIFQSKLLKLKDYLSKHIIPGSSGNYMFTKESWIRAEGYPEFAGALDTWGFGLRQIATGSKMLAMSNSHYYHRYGYDSYLIRFSKKRKKSIIALQILIPFLDLIDERDVKYIFSKKGRYIWYEKLRDRPIRVKVQNTNKMKDIISHFLFNAFGIILKRTIPEFFILKIKGYLDNIRKKNFKYF